MSNAPTYATVNCRRRGSSEAEQLIRKPTRRARTFSHLSVTHRLDAHLRRANDALRGQPGTAKYTIMGADGPRVGPRRERRPWGSMRISPLTSTKHPRFDGVGRGASHEDKREERGSKRGGSTAPDPAARGLRAPQVGSVLFYRRHRPE